MKRVLVTGGCGFIGSHLSRKLVSKGYSVDIVDDMSSGNLDLLASARKRVIIAGMISLFEDLDSNRKEGEILVIQGDMCDENVLDLIRSKRYDYIFHQAAIPRVLFSVENPSLTTENNVAKTVCMFEAAAGNVKRIINASSSSVYGGADLLPTSEDFPKDPKSPYAWQKSCIEDFVKIYCNTYNTEVVSLRYFNVFGPGQYGDSPYSTAIAAWCNAILEDLPLRSDGDGSQSRDMCYIDNIVNANILAAESEKKFFGECYNVACGDRTTNREILDYLVNRYPGIKIKTAPWRKGDVMHTQADISLIKKDLGYSPSVSIWEGLEKTIAWWGIDEKS